MWVAIAVLLGRAARWAARLRGGGSAIPGRVLLALVPGFLARAVERMPLGVVFVLGSNGKSTTTNMLVSILREHGVDVFSNPAGGNLPQGIASAMLANVPLSGRLREEIAVLEVDEAYGPALAAALNPQSALFLNVQVDQLNRFYEPERVVAMLETIANVATSALVINADDDNLRPLGIRVAATTGARLEYFGVSQAVRDAAPNGLANADVYGEQSDPVIPATVVTALNGPSATIEIAGESVELRLPARGLHYAVDVAGAASMARVLLGDRFETVHVAAAMGSLATVYGRGETLSYRGEEIEIIMMKNKPSLQMNLDYLERQPEQLLVTVDEGTPDPSWLYDIDLSQVSHVDVISGTKAWLIAARMAYSEIPVGAVLPDIKSALKEFLALPKPSVGNKVMIVNYEQMMLIRKQFGFLDLEGGS